MRHLPIILLALCSASCLATSGEIDRAIAEITGDIAAVARSGEESAEAARAAWQRGEIDYAELQARLQDIRAATLGTAKETAETVLEGVKDAIEQRPAEAIQTGANVVGGLMPGPWGEMIALLGAAAAAAYAKKRGDDAQRKAEDTAWDIEHERVKQLAKAEGKG